MKVIRSVLFSIIPVFFVLYLPAQATSYFDRKDNLKFKHLSVAEGLSQSSVFCIMQDSRGFMWFGTRTGGLNLYDGYTFKAFENDRNDSCSITDNEIITLYEDSDGQIWVGTRTGGLNKFNLQTECFSHYLNDKIDTTSISGNTILSIVEDAKGQLWIGTDNGLCLYHKDKDEFQRFLNVNNEGVFYDIQSMSVGGGDSLWLGTKQFGVVLFNTQTGKVLRRFQHEENNKYSISDNFVKVLHYDSKGRLWAGTRNDGLCRLDNIVSGEFTRFVHHSANESSIADNIVRTIHEDAKGVIWIGTKDGLDCLYPAEKDKLNPVFYHYQKDDNNANSLIQNSIYSFCEDDRGNLWVGTWSGGVDYLYVGNIKFNHYVHQARNKNSLSNNTVSSFVVDGEDLWIGTEGGGLNLFNRPENRFILYKQNKYDPNSLQINHIKSLYIDANKNLWVGAFDGLYLFNRETKKFTQYLKDVVVYTIEGDGDTNNYLWIGTLNSLYKFKVTDKTFKEYVSEKDDSRSLSHKTINVVYKDKNNDIWIGTKEGLNLYNRKDDSFIRYLNKQDDVTSLSNNFVSSICEDSEGNLWIGTLDGMNRYNPIDKSFEHYSKKEGLPDNVINSMLGDNEGNLWITTNKGLSKFNPWLVDSGRDFAIKNYDVTDGLQGNEFIRNASYKSSKGELFFGGVNGFNSFFPESLFDNPHIPNVVITDFKIFNKSVLIGKSGSPLLKHISQTDTLVLKDDLSVISFGFVSLNYVSPEKNQYAYIMEGFETEWNYVGNKREATYTNLYPGKYVFRVIASNNDGVWNEEGTSVTIIVLPPWWETLWFRIIGLMFLLTVFFGFYFYRVKALEKQKIVLEEKVEERTLELMEVNVELEEKHEEIVCQKEELINQKESIEKAYEDVDLLSRIGKEITMSLAVELITETVYKNLQSIMEMSVFWIGIYDSFEQRLVFKGAKSKGNTLPEFSYKLDDTSKLSVICFNSQEQILVKDFRQEYTKYVGGYLKQGIEDVPNSFIYIPLVVNEKKIGVISVQSFNKNAYTDYHLKILKNIGIYTAIALDNAEAYDKIENQARILVEYNTQLKEKQEEIQRQYENLTASEEEMSQLTKELLFLNEELLSQKKALEETIEQLKNTQSQLVHSEKMASIGILTAGVAHEINNPLNFIQGSKSALKSYIEENLQQHTEELLPLIEIIDVGVHRATDIVSSLNRFNRRTFNYNEVCDVHLILDNCLTISQNSLKDKVELIKKYTHKSFTLLGNEGELHQLLINVLTNAEQAIADKGIITIETTINNKQLQLKVIDSGSGIPQENLKRITEPFFTTKAPGKGTGLGLSIAYSIVEKHNGKMNFESEYGKGTTVTITLPVKD
jgi:ligand-binding sensor domain-containing protein/signal transduction histidine kinase